MAKKEIQLDHLKYYVPDGTLDRVVAFLRQYKVHLTITRERRSILGDYRHKTQWANHRISINGNLNPFSFLITFLHELAHLLTFENYGNRVSAHGAEWKKIYGEVLKGFLDQGIFPWEIENEIHASLHRPAASSCAEQGLLRLLRKYDPVREGHKLVEEIDAHALFRTKDNRVFKKGVQLRKRFKCIEVHSGKVYLFSPVCEVVELTE